MRDHYGRLSFTPRLPAELTRLTFRLSFRGRRLMVAVERDRAIYSLLEDAPLEITDHADNVSLTSGTQVIRSIRQAC